MQNDTKGLNVALRPSSEHALTSRTGHTLIIQIP